MLGQGFAELNRASRRPSVRIIAVCREQQTSVVWQGQLVGFEYRKFSEHS